MSESTIEYIPLTALRESPFNPRKSFDPAGLEELANSIKSQGIMQPLVARMLPMGAGDLYCHYELIFGHRRLRAAALAGLERVPVILRDMSDEQAAIAQVHENIKRLDVTPMEEADSFTFLATTHGMKPDDIAAAVGKSRSYVYGRLKLAKCDAKVREAVTSQGLSAETALEIARLPQHALQRTALGRITRGNGEWVSTRAAAQTVRNMLGPDLENSPRVTWALDDATLAQAAGACTSCSRRAGNNPDLAGVLPESQCMDKSCADVKATAQTERHLSTLGDAGHNVLRGDKAQEFMPQWWNRPRGYIETNDDAWDDADGATIDWEQAISQLGIKLPTLTVLVDSRGEIRKFFSQAAAAAIVATHRPDLATAGDAKGTPPAAYRGEGEGKEDGQDTDVAGQMAPLWARINSLEVKQAIVKKIMSTPRTADELRKVLSAEADAQDGLEMSVERALGWDPTETTEPYESAIDALTIDQVAGALVAHFLLCSTDQRGLPALAERYGIDPLNPTAEEEVNQSVDAGSAGSTHATVDDKTADMFDQAEGAAA